MSSSQLNLSSLDRIGPGCEGELYHVIPTKAIRHHEVLDIVKGTLSVHVLCSAMNGI